MEKADTQPQIKARGETPKNESLFRSKNDKSKMSRVEHKSHKESKEQKDLLKGIATTEQRRIHPVYVSPAKRQFRNTGYSFNSTEDQPPNSKPDSFHNMAAVISRGVRNVDLTEVTTRREYGSKNNSKLSNKIKSPLASNKSPKPNNLSFKCQIPYTNLTQAYTEGVSKLIKTLPF